MLATPASAACVSSASRGWHCDRDGFGAAGSPERALPVPALGTAPGWQPLPTPGVRVRSLPPRPGCPQGEQPQGSPAVGAVDACLREPITGSCLLAGTFAVHRKTHLMLQLRNMEEKPVLVTPKNPLAGMRHSAWGPSGMARLCFCSSCSFSPTRPATNQRRLRLPNGMLAAFIFSELIFSTASLLAALAACRAARQVGGLRTHCPPAALLSRSRVAAFASLASPRASLAWPRCPADHSTCSQGL